MQTKERAVREVALALGTAIADAEAAGYRIDWPASAAGLAAIAISETAAVKPEPEPAARSRLRPAPGRPSE